MKLKQITLYSLIISVTLFLYSCGAPTDKSEGKNDIPAVPVVLQNPISGTDNSIDISGQIESAQSANISTRVMGYITDVKVKAGDRVQKGQLLVTISNNDILAKRAQAQAMIAGAEASFKSAEKDYQRFTNLYNEKSATAKELDNVTLQYQTAKADVQSAKEMKAEADAMLAYTNITAPFSGVVAQKLVDAGSIANPGMPILVLEQNGNLQVSAVIPETEINRIRLKASTNVVVKSVERSFKGEIVEISPSSIGTGGQYVVKISIPREMQGSLNAGMYVNVKISAPGRDADVSEKTVLAPVSAIRHVGQLDVLYTLSHDSTALLRYVRLGKTHGTNVEILSGLNQDESFISSADGKLFNGVPVRIK